jgi:hypothetical protein
MRIRTMQECDKGWVHRLILGEEVATHVLAGSPAFRE